MEVNIEIISVENVNVDIQLRVQFDEIIIDSPIRKLNQAQTWKPEFTFRSTLDSPTSVSITLYQTRTFWFASILGNLEIASLFPSPETEKIRRFSLQTEGGICIRFIAIYDRIENEDDYPCEVEDILTVLKFEEDGEIIPIPPHLPHAESLTSELEELVISDEEFGEEEEGDIIIHSEVDHAGGWISGSIKKDGTQIGMLGHPTGMPLPLTKEEEEKIKMMQRRKNIVKEMFDTETSYLDFLKTVIDKFLTPLPKAIKDKSVLAEFSSILFQNVADIQSLHWDIYKQMLERIANYSDDIEWMDIFTSAFQQENFKEIYQKYINGYDRASNLAGNAKKAFDSKSLLSTGNVEALGVFIEKKLASCPHNFGSITSYLIAPVQRLPRYILYFRDLLKCTSEDHPDHEHLVQALASLNAIMSQINKEKGVYDKIYRIEEIYGMFSEEDRQEVSMILEPVRELILEGGMLAGAKNAKKCYILLFTDLIICAIKKSETLKFEWKVELCYAEVEFASTENDGFDTDKEETDSTDEPLQYIKITSQKKITEYPFTLTRTHKLFEDPSSSQSFYLWKEKIEIALKTTKNILFLHETTKFAVSDLQNQLLSEVGEELFETWEQKVYAKDDIIRKIGKRSNYIYLIRDGVCVIHIKVGEEMVEAGELIPGQFIGEMSYLSNKKRKEVSSAMVICSSDTVIAMRTSYRNLNKQLNSNSILASKFFLLLCILLANRLLKEQSDTSDWKRSAASVTSLSSTSSLSSTMIKSSAASSSTASLSSSSLSTSQSLHNVNLSSASHISSTALHINSSTSVPSVVSSTASIPSFNMADKGPILCQFQCTMKPHSTVGVLKIMKEKVTYKASNFFGLKRKVEYDYRSITKVEEVDETSNLLRISYFREKKRKRKNKSVDFAMKNSTELFRAIRSITPLMNQFKPRSSSVSRSKTRKSKKKSKNQRSDRDYESEAEITSTTEDDPSSTSDLSIHSSLTRSHHNRLITMSSKELSTDSDLTSDASEFDTFSEASEVDVSDVEEVNSTPRLSRRGRSPKPRRTPRTSSQKPDDQNEKFFQLKKKDWKILHDTAEPTIFTEGMTIIEQGTIPNSLFQLIEGVCRVEHLMSSGNSLNIFKIRSGEIFGELSFITGLVSSASIVADEKCTVMALNRSKLELLLFNEPRIAAALYRFIATTLRNRVLENQRNRELKLQLVNENSHPDTKNNDVNHNQNNNNAHNISDVHINNSSVHINNNDNNSNDRHHH